MKVLVISNFYSHAARSGAVQVASRISSELVARGHRVTALSTMPFSGFSSLRAHLKETDLERVERFHPINLYYAPNAARYPFPVRLLSHAVDMWSPHPKWVTAEMIRRLSPDVILTHNLKGFGLQACAAIRESGVPWLHTVHDVQLSVPSGLLIAGEENAFLNRGWPRRLYEQATIRAVGSPDVVISPSKFLSDFYRERGFFPKSQVEVMQNPAPIVPFHPPNGRTDGPMRLVYYGQLEEHKGIRFLLHAMERLDIPFQLHVVGEGALAPLVERWAKDDARVRYHGFKSFEPFTKLLALCDATILPSLCYENSPTSIYESFAAGKPAIASRIGGIGELIQDGVNGMLLPVGDTEAWRVGLKKFASEIAEYRARSVDIRNGVEKYALPNYVDRLETLMRDAIGRTGTR